MGYEWTAVIPGMNDDHAAYGHQTIDMFPGEDSSYVSTWAMVWYDDVPAYDPSPAPSQYSYQVQVPYEYYADVPVTTSYNGMVVAQTFVAPRAGWLTHIDLFFTQIAADGDVKVLLCRTVGGKPDTSKVLSQVTVARADLKKYPTETKVAMTPVMVESGGRYAIVLITQGAHYVAMADAGFTEGTFFTGTDGAFFQGDILKDLKFKVYMARFVAPRSEIVLQNISLAGGISDLAIRTDQPVLDGASLTYEAQIAGKWEPLTGLNLGKLSGMPDIIPLRAVFLGTADIQVGLQLGAGRVVASRPTVSSTVVSQAITVSSKRYFQVDLVVNRWDETKNTVTAQILTGAGYATVTASSTAVVLDEGSPRGWKRLRFTFDTGTPVNSYKVKTVLTRATDGKPVRRMERTSIATG